MAKASAIHMKYIIITILFCTLNCSSIVNKLAFYPTRNNLIDISEIPANIQEIFLRTQDDNYISCLYLNNPNAKRIALYFHGNAENIYQNVSVLEKINKCGLSAFGVEYQGYGKSSGRPSEKSIYRDATTCFQYVVDSLRFKKEDIILIGRSIGSAAACNTAAEQGVCRLVLITPISTGKEYCKAHGLGFFRMVAGNSFDNIEKCKKITCPIMIVAATDDEVMPSAMVQNLYSSITTMKSIFWVNDAHHNDILYRGSDSLWESLGSFVK
jgi:pimeloyl-ACP methyl ester carboxylesterase